MGGGGQDGVGGCGREQDGLHEHVEVRRLSQARGGQTAFTSTWRSDGRTPAVARAPVIPRPAAWSERSQQPRGPTSGGRVLDHRAIRKPLSLRFARGTEKRTGIQKQAPTPRELTRIIWSPRCLTAALHSPCFCQADKHTRRPATALGRMLRRVRVPHWPYGVEGHRWHRRCSELRLVTSRAAEARRVDDAPSPVVSMTTAVA